MSVPEYLTTIQNALTFEEDQCQYYYEKSKEKMLATTEREMITEHLETLVKVSIEKIILILIKWIGHKQ